MSVACGGVADPRQHRVSEPERTRAAPLPLTVERSTNPRGQMGKVTIRDAALRFDSL